MTDLSLTVAPKSDQLNSDDLISGARTVKITSVKADPGSAEQPIAIHFEGDNGKPYKPCKSMRRVLLQVWGKDGLQYPGRSMTLFRDQKVQFGGLAVGGIRISHMSHMDADMTMALTSSRASRKPYTVKPLIVAAPHKTAPAPSVDDYKFCDDQETFDALEKMRGDAWKSLDAQTKAALKAASDSAKSRLIEPTQPEATAP